MEENCLRRISRIVQLLMEEGERGNRREFEQGG